VVITGGSSGIGLACGVEAASRGARVAILARSADKFDAALRAINAAGGSGNGGATAHACDVTDAPAAAAALAAAAAAHGGRVDVLIASAGISQPRRFEETPTDEFEAVLRLNVTGVRNAVAAALPHMAGRGAAVPLADGGRIVLVSSQAGQAGLYGYTAYSVRARARACARASAGARPARHTPHPPLPPRQASKFALHGFAQALSQELHRRRILVSQVFPPDTDTPLLASENLQKPAVTRLLSEATATVQPAAVARATLDGVQRWAPAIPVGFDGWMLATLTPGMGPAGSLAAALVQAATMGLWRLVGLAYVQHWYGGVIAKHDADPAAAAAAAAAATAASSAGRAKSSSPLAQPLVSAENKSK
jgi:3-dehydrosphinganine reductase